MDAFSVSAGVVQNVGYCGQCTVTLAKWMGRVKNVDEKLQDFYDKVSALQLTHKNLKRSLETPSTIEAARNVNVSDRRLWTQINLVLEDCKKAVTSINRILTKIQPNRLGRADRHLMESLNVGDLAPYFERIWMFNGTLQLPVDMITITQQLSSHDMTEEKVRLVESKMAAVNRKIELLSERIELRRPMSLDSRTFIVNSRASFDSGASVDSIGKPRFIYHNCALSVAYAKEFMVTITAAANLKGCTPQGTPEARERRAVNIDRDIRIPLQLPEREHAQLDPTVPLLPALPRELPTPESSEHDQWQENLQQNEPHLENEHNEEDDINIPLAKTFVAEGQHEVEKENYEAAEENFREALDLINDDEFSAKLAFQSADVTLMLANCLFHLGKDKPEKYVEAVALLKPLTDASDPSAQGTSELGQVLAAEHLLGMVWHAKGEYASAEKHAQNAFKGRRKLFREQHPQTIESIQLLVTIYVAMGKGVKARGFAKSFLPPLAQRDTVSTPNIETPVSPLISQAAIQGMPSPSSTARLIGQRANSFPEGESMASLSLRPTYPHDSALTHMSADERHALKPKFLAIQSLAMESKDKAIAMAMSLLKFYDPEPSRLLMVHDRDIRKNIDKRGVTMGLAATGYGYAPIHFFCELTNREAVAEVQLLIEQGVDLTAVRHQPGWRRLEPMTPLQLAIEKGHENISLVILDALRFAAHAGQSIIDLDALKDKDGLSPLLAACRRGFIRLVPQLLDFGAAVHTAFPSLWYGNSLLHDACARCDIQMVKLLLMYEDGRVYRRRDIGTISQVDDRGLTPLMYAASTMVINSDILRKSKTKRRLNCMKILLEHCQLQGSADVVFLIADRKGKNLFAHVLEENDPDLRELVEDYLKLSRSGGLPKELE